MTPECTQAVENDVLVIENREIQAIRTCDDVAWFDFRALCDGPRSQNDYIELGKIFHAVLLSNVEQMGVTTDDIARRFINMVDEFYDRNVKLIISAEVELKDLYTGGRLSFEFQRTLSRLLEMQSHEFWRGRTSPEGSYKLKPEQFANCSGFLSRGLPLEACHSRKPSGFLHELLPVLIRGQFGVLTEQPGEEAGVVVTHFIADGLDALARTRQEPLGRLDTQTLEVMQGLVAGGALETAHEVADAHAVVARYVLEAELVGEVLLQPVLDLQDDQVPVQLLSAKAHASGV